MEIDSNSCNVGEKWAQGHMQKRSLSNRPQIVCTFPVCQTNVTNLHIWFYLHVSTIGICVTDADIIARHLYDLKVLV